MKFPIKIYSPTFTPTASGGRTEVYNLITADFAEITDSNPSKYTDGHGVGQEQVKTFTIDYRPSLNITQTCRILFDGVYFNILTIVKDGNKNFKYVIQAKAKI